MLVRIGGLTAVLGAYYGSAEELRTFGQVLVSVKFDSLPTTRGATALTPRPPPPATP